jgi:hypothetical protein
MGCVGIWSSLVDQVHRFLELETDSFDCVFAVDPLYATNSMFFNICTVNGLRFKNSRSRRIGLFLLFTSALVEATTVSHWLAPICTAREAQTTQIRPA